MTKQETGAGDLNDLAKTDGEAQARYELTKNRDPFPSIYPALLNSADISDYVRLSGMLFPFHPKKLKSASYEAALKGECIEWDSSGERRRITLTSPNDTFTLKKNSIAFVQVEPFFRLPDYIALRFNLKITHVHRGILLGTGPLIDPGYQGKLLIPLHNLTTNDYVFPGGEGLIWIEFTKTSEIKRDDDVQRDPITHERKGEYIEFPISKNQRCAIQFLQKACPSGAIRSSIPTAIDEARRLAHDAQKEVANIRRIGFVAGVVSILALVVGLAAIAYQQYSLTQDSVSLVKSTYDKLSEIEKNANAHLEHMSNRLGALERAAKTPSGTTPPEMNGRSTDSK